MPAAAPPAYPPADHVLGRLRLEVENREPGVVIGWIPVTDAVRDARGGLRAGVAATLIDVVGGGFAVQTVRPDWTATADLTFHGTAPLVGPWVVAEATIVHRGRTTVVVEVRLGDVAEPGQAVARATAGAFMTFAVLPRRDGNLVFPEPEMRRRRSVAPDSSPLDDPITAALGISTGPDGSTTLPVTPFVRNSLGGVQGGIMALLGEVAGTGAIGPTASAVDLHVAYLALGRIGPITAATEVTSGRTAEVRLTDPAANRLTTLVQVATEP
jgi:acyl-coenzyme A thioesterase PaaI-like protein